MQILFTGSIIALVLWVSAAAIAHKIHFYTHWAHLPYLLGRGLFGAGASVQLRSHSSKNAVLTF